MKIFMHHKYDGGYWFRLFGIGLSFVDREKHRPLFSERMGYTTVLRMGKWSIKYLCRFK